MNFRRDEADKAYDCTCDWILRNEDYITWTREERGLLWIKGKPGAGKSTLMAYIYRQPKNMPLEDRTLALDFFFHGRGTPLQKTQIGMFRSLLHQIFTLDPSVRAPIR